MEEKEIGHITHYFAKIEVGVLELNQGELEVGDKIHIQGSTTDMEQKVKSMQVEHEEVKRAKKGDAVGLKVEEPVREGDKVYKILE
jgi:putative protease